MKNSQKKVFLSIITATYNSGKDLKTTAFNLRKIPKEHYEWIIVDGGSSDDTIDVVFSNLDIIDKWISESDYGIYDACGL